ncbi:conserved hypothetical protein [Trichinella spiralis]|uniref:hypothetical protein n=1 Tax=Trichinella spiralis TaxID=6334 RepID=UPI0001EFCD94|nr:conserved hypothetical protein [Trichinella spiralis]
MHTSNKETMQKSWHSFFHIPCRQHFHQHKQSVHARQNNCNVYFTAATTTQHNHHKTTIAAAVIVQTTPSKSFRPINPHCCKQPTTTFRTCKNIQLENNKKRQNAPTEN